MQQKQKKVSDFPGTFLKFTMYASFDFWALLICKLAVIQVGVKALLCQ